MNRDSGEGGEPAAWASEITDWTGWLAAADRPPTTIYLRDYQVRRFARDHPDPWAVTFEDLIAWLGGQEWATETRRSYRAALRSFYGWAHSTGRMTHNPAGLLPPIKRSEGIPRPAPLTVVRRAVSEAPPRTRLMVLLAVQQGLRRGEIARVHTDDVERDLDGWSLRVTGKGRRQRRVPLDETTARVLKSMPAGWVFPGKVNGHLSPARVGELVSEVLGTGWTAHTLRHRFATSAYAGARDLFAVQTLLGHQSPDTTRRYVLLEESALRRTAEHARLHA
jgi:integrase